MKKAIVIGLAVLALAVVGAILFRAFLPSLLSYALGRATGARVTSESAGVTIRQGNLVAELRNVVLKGTVEGTVERLRISLRLAAPVKVIEVAASGYDVAISTSGTAGRAPVLPVESLALERGRVTFRGYTLLLPEITVRKAGGRENFAFTVRATESDATGSIVVSGTGEIRSGKVVVDGTADLKGLYIKRWIKELDGIAEGSVRLNYDGERLSLNGPVAVTSFAFKEYFLRKPLTLPRAEGNMMLSLARGLCRIDIVEVKYGGTLLNLGFLVEKGRLGRFDMSSGFLDIAGIHDQLDFQQLLESDLGPRETVPEGKVKVRRLTVDRGIAGSADLEVRDGKVTVEGLSFTAVEGTASVDEKAIRLSGMKGTLNENAFYDVSGSIGISGGGITELDGRYKLDMADLPILVTGLEHSGLRFKAGVTTGNAQIRGKGVGSLQVRGSGTLHDAEVSYRRASFKARGDYRFQGREVSFDPLILRKGRSEITVRGRWGNRGLDVMIKGMIEMESLRAFAEIPPGIAGPLELDGTLSMEEETITSSGEVGMENLSVEVPGVFRKPAGTASRAQVAFSVNEQGIRVERLLYNVDMLDIDVKGTRSTDGQIDADVKLTCADVGRLAPLFFFEGTPSGGKIEAAFTVGNLKIPLQKLPEVHGSITMQGGFFPLPGMKKDLENVNANVLLKGTEAEIELKGLRMGSTVVSKGLFHLENLEESRFKLDLHFDNLDPSDAESEGPFRLRPINREGLLARSSGEITMNAAKARFGATEGKDCTLRASFDRGRLDVESLTMEVFGGAASVTGGIDFLSDPPSLTAAGEVKQIESGHVLNTFAGAAETLKGKTDISGRLATRGRDVAAMVANLEGEVKTYSREGVIKRWNMLSKVLTVFSLNFYDMFRGKMDLTTEGIPYSAMGGVFKAKDGVLHTDNFIIDSPSLFIAGNGDLNLNTRLIDGSIVVSPLLPIDTTLGKIPLLGSILRGKERTFLYVAYTVKGPPDNPEISMSVTKTIGGRALGWFKNLFLFPLEVLPK